MNTDKLKPIDFLDGIDIEELAVNRLNDDDELNIHSFAEAVIRAWIEKQEVVITTSYYTDDSGTHHQSKQLIAKPSFKE